MNIFKKTFNLDFLKRVELRVMQQLKESIPQQRKLYTKEILQIFGWTSSVLFGATVLKYIGQHSINTFMNILASLSALVLVVDIPLMIFLFGYYIYHQYLLIDINKNLSYQNYYYHKLINTFNVIEHTYLNSNEIDELLSMSLNPKQIEFLQKRIIQYSHFSLADLTEMLIEGEAIEEQKNKEQQEINNFLTKHNLEHHSSPYMLLDKKENKALEKEKNLSSLL